MIAEGFREVGVLIFVFANLDELVAGKASIVWILSAAALGILFFVLGIYLERRRSE